MKSALALASVAVALALAPVHAQTKMSCTEDAMKKMEVDAAAMTDTQKKEMTMKEMSMAKDMMAKKDEKGCMMHMEKAMGMMPTKS